MKRRGIRKFGEPILSGMKAPAGLPLGRVERTLFLVRNRLESFNELAFHTGIDRPWIESLARNGEKALRGSQDFDRLDALHDWLFALELACPRQRAGPPKALTMLGAAALYIEDARLEGSVSFAANDRRHIYQFASKRLRDLLLHNNWCPQPSDDKRLLPIRLYVQRGRNDDHIFSPRKRPTYCGELDDFTLPIEDCLFD